MHVHVVDLAVNTHTHTYMCTVHHKMNHHIHVHTEYAHYIGTCTCR